MADVRLSSPYPLADKSHPLLPSIHSVDGGDSHSSTSIKKLAPKSKIQDSPSGADYEYLERRLREFGCKAPPPLQLSLPVTPSNVNNTTSLRVENDLISLARAVESNSGCKLAKCVVCEKGLPESFHLQKPVSWLSVCKLAMWALTQDGTAHGRKWFSLGRDICPFVEVHKYVCGREFTPNWKTTIGITMSTYAKRANMFIAGNPNELGLGYYMLPEEATDPYLETTPLIIGRHYRTPNPHSQPNTNSRSATPPASLSRPSSPIHATAGTLSAPSTPPHTPTTHIRPVTPPRISPPSPVQFSTTPTRHRSSTPPPIHILTPSPQRAIIPSPQRAITPSPQRTITPPPLMHVHIPPSPREHVYYSAPTTPTIPASPVILTPQSPHSVPPVSHHPLPATPSPIPIPPAHSPMDTEISSYMNDPSCFMGVIRMRRKRFNGEMSKRAIGERKHTTDNERQLLLDYYDKFGTCTTVPEFTELQQRLGWDAHRTKIWLYNRKTYHHHRPGEKRKKMRTSSPNADGSSVTYEGDSDDEFYDENSMDDNDRDKSDMMEDEGQQEYIIELESLVSSLKQQMEKEIDARKGEVGKSQATAEKIAELEKTLARDPRLEPTESDSEVALLRKQVDLYFNDLREEKKKRAQEEIKSLDYLAQINGLNLRITTLEKALQSASKSGSQEPAQPAQAMQDTVDARIDAQGRKVFGEASIQIAESPDLSNSSGSESAVVPSVPISA